MRITKKQVGIAVVAVGVLIILNLFFLGKTGVFELYSGYKMVRQQATDIKNAHMTIDSLKAQIKQLENDTVYLERMAREKLGMARKNEKIYKFVEEK